MEGYLEVWVGFFSRWTQYYFRLHEDTLYFGPAKDRIESKIHLKVAQIANAVEDPISFIIHTGTETLNLRASSIEERVLWLKKIKKVQKKVEQANYLHEISLVDQQLGSNSKIKALEQLTAQIWQSHAQMENIIEQICMRVTGSSTLRDLTHQLTTTVEAIKNRSAAALKIIEQSTLKIARNKADPSNDLSSSSFSVRGDGTRYLSFDDNQARIFRRTSKNSVQSGDFTKYESFENGLPSNSNQDQIIPVKQRLISFNPVYQKIKSTINDNTSRAHLPVKFTPEEKFSFLSIFSGVGSDLTRFSFPVTVNEPLSFLQKGCEQMYYSELLDRANSEMDPEQRILYVSAFIVSQYSLNDQRTKKPFNPLLGETFELVDRERGFEFLSEQVCHHPPISAIHCRSKNFEIIDNSKNKTTFTGSSLKFVPQSNGKITLQRLKDSYSFSKCTMTLNNLMMGKLYLENTGQVKIVCKKLNTQALLNFKQQSIWKKDQFNSVEGEIIANGETKFFLSGKWNESLMAHTIKQNSQVKLWEKTHRSNPDYYNFNQYTLNLNHLNRKNFKEIAPTDTRLRPDQRALEMQDLQLAASQKHRLQQKQRAVRKENQQTGKEHQIMWFRKQIDEDQEEVYLSNGQYWEERKKGQWSICLDIF